MEPSEDTAKPKPHVPKEYEDPHFHDEDQELADETGPKARNTPTKKPARRVPPPRRRFTDD